MILPLDFSGEVDDLVRYEASLRDAGVLERRHGVQASWENRGRNGQTIQSSSLWTLELSKEPYVFTKDVQ
jgi:hypothetical protein